MGKVKRISPSFGYWSPFIPCPLPFCCEHPKPVPCFIEVWDNANSPNSLWNGLSSLRAQLCSPKGGSLGHGDINPTAAGPFLLPAGTQGSGCGWGGAQGSLTSHSHSSSAALVPLFLLPVAYGKIKIKMEWKMDFFSSHTFNKHVWGCIWGCCCVNNLSWVYGMRRWISKKTQTNREKKVSSRWQKVSSRYGESIISIIIYYIYILL